MRVFVTGITGTLGTALAELHHGRGDFVWGCARNESKAVEWWGRRPDLARPFVADAAAVREFLAFLRADVLYHCAAMKHVELCEANPATAWRENVELTHTVSLVCRELGVRFVLVSSDKACLPRGVYGATKLVAERVAVGNGGAAVRLGNLIGSSGSVFAKWKAAAERGGRIALTDPDMTRYFIPVGRAAEFLADGATAGRVSAPAGMRSVRMGTVAATLRPDRDWDVTGPRPGETTHQWLFAPGDRVAKVGDEWVLCEDAPAVPSGLSSETADRWDVRELLAAAGVKL